MCELFCGNLLKKKKMRERFLTFKNIILLKKALKFSNGRQVLFDVVKIIKVENQDLLLNYALVKQQKIKENNMTSKISL